MCIVHARITERFFLYKTQSVRARITERACTDAFRTFDTKKYVFNYNMRISVVQQTKVQQRMVHHERLI